MKCIALTILFFLLAIPCARGETMEKVLSGVDLEPLQSISERSGAEIDIRELAGQLLRGEVRADADVFFEWIAGKLKNELYGLTAVFFALLLPLLLWAFNEHLVDGTRAGAKAAGFVCYLSAAGTLVYIFGGNMTGANRAIGQIREITGQLFPILTSLLVASGKPATANLFTPMASLISGAAMDGVFRFGQICLSCAAALVVAGNMNERMPLKGMSGMFLSVSNWLMGLSMSAFIGYVTVSGTLASGYDGVTVRTARYTVDNIMPIIGGEVADTMDIALHSVVAVKNTVGITGALLVLAICLMPMIRMVAALMAVKLSAAFVEPLASGFLTRLVDQFSKVLVAVLVQLVTAVVIFLALVGAMVSTGTGG